MKKRIVAILMAAAMASAMITACGSEETQTTSEESTDSESGSEVRKGITSMCLPLMLCLQQKREGLMYWMFANGTIM